MNFGVNIIDANGRSCEQSVSLPVNPEPECVDWPSMNWGAPSLITVGDSTKLVRTFTPSFTQGNIAIARSENLDNTADGTITNTFQVPCTKIPCTLKLSILFEHYASSGTGLDSITVYIDYGIFGPATFFYISNIDPDGLRVFNLNVNGAVPFLVTGSVSARALGIGGPPGYNTWSKGTVTFEVL